MVFDENNCSEVLKDHFRIMDLSGLGILKCHLALWHQVPYLNICMKHRKFINIYLLVPYSTSIFMI